MEITEILFSLIRSVICSTPVPCEVTESINIDTLTSLYDISASHDIAHIIAEALSNLGKLGDDEISKKFKNKAFIAFYRYERMNYELQRICDTLENAKIKFVPLKGAVIRKLYPEEWLRTSCDIDVLVQEKDLAKTALLLKEKLNYLSDDVVKFHDMSLYSQNGVHLELHHNIKENMKAIDALLEKVWENCILVEGKKYQYKQTDEYLIFHIIAHMSYHFLDGGCGIRPIIDLWLLDNIEGVDKSKCDKLLNECGIFKFAEMLRKLGRIWLLDEPHDAITEKMQNYILSGGVYGNFENKLKVINRKKCGKIRYLLSKAFISYDVIKIRYPILKKLPYLTPIMQVRRWFEVVFYGKANKAIKEVYDTKNVLLEKNENIKELLEEIGL